METVAILGLAVALGTDAFSVAVAAGIALPTVTGRHVFRIAWHFGLFQFLMPVIGWGAGRYAAEFAQRYDHWIACVLLGAIGAKMIVDALFRAEGVPRGDPTRGMSLVALSVATSLDALAVGVSLALLRVTIIIPSLIIGCVAGVMSLVGIRVGRHVGALLGKRVECLGGVVLIGLAVKILFDHLGG